MSQNNIPPATMITAPDSLKRCAEAWLTESLLGIDTESNSLYAYQGRVCLLQISTRDEDFIVDPLAFDDLSVFDVLAPVMASPEVEKVFHAADQDVAILKRDFGFTFATVFDTALAARICGVARVGLNHLLEDEIGVYQNKRHQRDNWGERPLMPESLHYAQMDSHYLPALRDIFKQRLEREGHTEEAEEAFRELCDVVPMSGSDYDPEGYWGIGMPARLKRSEMRILRELYQMREDIARTLDEPVYKVLSNKALLELSRIKPRHRMDMERISDITPRQIRRYSGEIIDAVKRARNAPRLPRPPRHKAPSPRIADRYAMLHQWRKGVAAARGVESDVILSKHTLWQVAKRKPRTLEEIAQIPGFGPWRVKTYGPQILKLLKRIQ